MRSRPLRCRRGVRERSPDALASYHFVVSWRGQSARKTEIEWSVWRSLLLFARHGPPPTGSPFRVAGASVGCGQHGIAEPRGLHAAAAALAWTPQT